MAGRPAGAQNKDKPFRAALVRALKVAEGDPDLLDEIADALIGKARDGDTQAIREVADRLDGKPPLAIIGDDDAPAIRLIVTGVPRAGD